MNNYLKNLLIVCFALAIVLLGAKELQRSQRRQAARGNVTREETKGVLSLFKGTDLRARLSDQALKEQGSSAKSSRASSGSSWFPLNWFSSDPKKKITENPNDPEDDLNHSDREELNNLINDLLPDKK